MAKKLSRAYWKGKYYFREGNKSWRENVGGKVVKAPKSTNIEELRRLEGKTRYWEPTLAHPYTTKQMMSQEQAKSSMRLFGVKRRM